MLWYHLLESPLSLHQNLKLSMNITIVRDKNPWEVVKHMSQIHQSILDRGTNLEGMEAPIFQQSPLSMTQGIWTCNPMLWYHLLESVLPLHQKLELSMKVTTSKDKDPWEVVKHISQIHQSMLDRGTNLEGMEAPTSQKSPPQHDPRELNL